MSRISVTLATLFTAYVLALYGPMLCIYVLSFQDLRGGLVFPQAEKETS